MRYRLKEYYVDKSDNTLYVHIKKPSGVTVASTEAVKEAVRLVIDEDAKVVFTSSMQKDKMYVSNENVQTGYDYRLSFNIPTGKNVSASDKFTIEMDWGLSAEELAKESTLTDFRASLLGVNGVAKLMAPFVYKNLFNDKGEVIYYAANAYSIANLYEINSLSNNGFYLANKFFPESGSAYYYPFAPINGWEFTAQYKFYVPTVAPNNVGITRSGGYGTISDIPSLSLLEVTAGITIRCTGSAMYDSSGDRTNDKTQAAFELYIFEEIQNAGNNSNEINLADIRNAIPSVPTDYAKQGGTSTATLSATQEAVTDGTNTAIGMLKDQTNGLAAIKGAIPTIPTDYAKAGSGTNVTNTDLKTLLNGISTSMYKGVPIASQTGSATIQPNTWNIWSTDPSAAFTITKGTDIANITNVYMARFTLDANWASGTQVSFSGWNSLDWNGGAPTWTAGYTYEINIVDNIAMWAEIAPSV